MPRENPFNSFGRAARSAADPGYFARGRKASATKVTELSSVVGAIGARQLPDGYTWRTLYKLFNRGKGPIARDFWLNTLGLPKDVSKNVSPETLDRVRGFYKFISDQCEFIDNIYLILMLMGETPCDHRPGYKLEAFQLYRAAGGGHIKSLFLKRYKTNENVLTWLNARMAKKSFSQRILNAETLAAYTAPRASEVMYQVLGLGDDKIDYDDTVSGQCRAASLSSDDDDDDDDDVALWADDEGGLGLPPPVQGSPSVAAATASLPLLQSNLSWLDLYDFFCTGPITRYFWDNILGLPVTSPDIHCHVVPDELFRRVLGAFKHVADTCKYIDNLYLILRYMGAALGDCQRDGYKPDTARLYRLAGGSIVRTMSLERCGTEVKQQAWLRHRMGKLPWTWVPINGIVSPPNFKASVMAATVLGIKPANSSGGAGRGDACESDSSGESLDFDSL